MIEEPATRAPHAPQAPCGPEPAPDTRPDRHGPPQGRTAVREPSARLLDSDCELTSYRELATLLDNLPMLLREARRGRQLSGRAAGAEIGISVSTISRVENGAECSLPNAVAVLRWLDRQGGPDA